jgi:phosphoribosylformylglycinamidine synthase
MGEFIGKIHVNLKPEVPDNSGSSLVKTLHQLGFAQVLEAKTGKYLEVTLQARSHKQATKQIEQMNTIFFANPVIEVATTESVTKVPKVKPRGSRRQNPKAE